MSKSGSQINAVLFDLDNTLIYFDEREFFGWYGESLVKYFADIFSPEELGKRIYNASRAMLVKDGSMLNADYFIKIFLEGDTITPEQCIDKADRRVKREFPGKGCHDGNDRIGQQHCGTHCMAPEQGVIHDEC